MARGLRDHSGTAQLKQKIDDGLTKRKLKVLLDTTEATVEQLRKDGDIPYSVHEGCDKYFNALFEAIRIQRNEAVHPILGDVDYISVRLMMLGFPHTCKKISDILEHISS